MHPVHIGMCYRREERQSDYSIVTKVTLQIGDFGVESLDDQLDSMLLECVVDIFLHAC